MNFIRNPRWHQYDVILSIYTHFCSEKFIRLYGHPITCFPTADLFKQLRLFKLATLEVVENRSKATIYRIRQTDCLSMQGRRGSGYGIYFAQRLFTIP